MLTQIELIKKYGLSVRGHLGQHVLIDANISRKIVYALQLGPKDKVLEIGPGLGALTGEILASGCRLVAVEKDARFAEILKTEYGKKAGKRFTVLHADILRLDLERDVFGSARSLFKVASNLPYYATAPILFHLIAAQERISQAVLMTQREVAKRMTATPGTKDYGRLTLGVRYCADVRHLFDVKPTCFTPRPQVHSSVIELRFRPASKMPKGTDEKALFDLIRLAFSQRRKTLLHLLLRDPAWSKDRESTEILLEELGFSAKVRGEELLLKDFMTLADRLKRKIRA